VTPPNFLSFVNDINKFKIFYENLKITMMEKIEFNKFIKEDKLNYA